jgi:lipopolysaccharide export system protein LptA
MKQLVFVGLLLLWMCGVAPVFAQTTTVHFTGDEMTNIQGRPGWVKLTNNVVIRYQGMTIRSNYAEINQTTQDFEARDNLRIRTKEGATITGLTLRNYPQQNVMVVDRNVVFTDVDSTQLFTDRMTYSRITEISTYTTGGKIVSDSTVLTSLIGHYHGLTGAFHCKTDVVIEGPNYTIHTDTLQMVDDVIFFFSPTHIWSDSNYAYCESGWYNAKVKIASLTDNAFIQTKEQKMYGDSIYYEMDTDFGVAFENVIVIDSVNDIIIHCDFALSDKKNGDSWFTKNAVGIMISEGDSLFLRGDTLRIAYDSNEEVRHMLAFYNVQFFRHDIQGASDSLAYVMADSTLTMFGSPIVWTNNDQLTGDTIRMLMSENRPKTAHLLNRAFIISKGYHEGHFNQTKGGEAIGFFTDSSELELIKVNERVETIYFVMEDADSSLIGILKVNNAERMRITLENLSITDIMYLEPPENGVIDGAMYPDAELSEKDRYLKGFLWQADRRPMSKFDIWPNAPRNAADDPFDFLERLKDLEIQPAKQLDD